MRKKSRNYVFFLIIAICFVLTGCFPLKVFSDTGLQNNSDSSDFILYNRAQLKAMRDSKNPEVQKSIRKIIEEADKYLKEAPISVTEKKSIQKGASAHEYVSLAVYYWPDPSKKDGLPYIKHDGRRNPELNDSDKYDALRKDKMVSAVNTLSICYYLTGKEEYASKAADFLRTWFINDNTRMNPDLNYSQCIPGKNEGGNTGIIDTVSFIQLTDSIRMIEGSRDWSPDDDKAIKKWFSDYTNWLTESPFGKKEAKEKNNHGVWYDAQVASYAYFSGDNALTKKIVEEAGKKRIDKQVEPDGKMPLELARTNSLNYTMFNLRAFITLARVGERVGTNLFKFKSEDGRSIEKALDYFNDYLQGKMKWSYGNIIKASPSQMAPYMAMANEYYKKNSYTESINKLLNSSNAQEIIMTYGNIQ